jgi:hypothetical protein
MSARRLFANCCIALGTAALLVGTPTAARSQSKALSLAEVMDLREHGVSSLQILRDARQYCIAFSVDDSVRQQLTVAGADTLLIGGLGSVCTSVRVVEKPLAPLIDDIFAESSTSQGFTWSNPRCRARFESDGVRMENTNTDVMCMVRYPSLDMPADVRVDLDILQLGTMRNGSVLLGFGRQDRSGNYYSLNVSADRHLELCWNSDRQCNSLVKVADVAALHADARGANRVSVEVRGSAIALLVNDERVAQYTADQPIGGRLMVGVGPQTSLLLVRLRVTPLR